MENELELLRWKAEAAKWEFNYHQERMNALQFIARDIGEQIKKTEASRAEKSNEKEVEDEQTT